MEVTFTRTGERRYAVSAEGLTMHPAPGYDDEIPHDLVHLAVEIACGIPMGVYGQLAAGGTAGTFRPADGTVDRKLRRRGERLAHEHADDLARSEQLAYTATVAFKLPDRPAASAELERVCVLLDELSARWRSLAVKESMTVPWPSPQRSPRAAGRPTPPAPRGAARRARPRARGSSA